MSEWQPIETAPKDGTPVRVRRDEGIFVCTWGHAWFDEERGWVSGYGGLNGKKKIHPVSPGGRNGPNLWMPLPNPPQPDSQSSRNPNSRGQ